MELESFKPDVGSEVPSFGRADRRCGERFPLTLNLRFRRVSKNENWTKGSSVNFSHTGILFRAERPTHLGAAVELVVDWPSNSGSVLMRELVVVGIVIRVRGHDAALSIRKFAFRRAQSTL
jgi:hypothetical protein